MQQNHQLRLKRKYYDLINSGKKTLEVRVGYAQIRKIKRGDTITFENYLPQQTFHVVRVTRYDSFAKMLDFEDSQKIIPGVPKDKALLSLQEIYPTEKEKLGVYVFELSKVEPYEIQILSALSLAKRNHKAFANLVANAYMVTDQICKDYPNHFNWYWSKTVPAVLNGSREILVCTVNRECAGVAFLKKENGEQKICTFLILEPFRGKHITTPLLERAFEFLGTTKPLISIADYKLDMFKGIINKYGWKKTQILRQGYYNDTSREIVFNGKIS